MNWNYSEYKLGRELSKVIDCVWFENYFDQPENVGATQSIFPDLSVELIFSESSIERLGFERNESVSLRCHLSGLKTKPQKVKVERSSSLGVRIKPSALYLFSEITPVNTIDNSIETNLIFSNRIKDLEDKVLESGSVDYKLHIVQSFFKELLALNHDKRDLCFEYMVDLINVANGNISLSILALKTGFSTKTIERKFKSRLGVSPKKYSRLVRVVNALKAYKYKNTLTSLAYDNFYYDQMHFVKEVKCFTGLTPTDFFSAGKGIQSPTFA
jgi:AraC-like DNA-binding protein